jgi:putative secretion ATPase (PEP-CTERM system associated)
MYKSFFNLLQKPFELLPNPDFLYLSKFHKRALTYLDYGIKERVGFILLTGEVGSGKTTIIRDLIKKHQDRVVLSKIFNTMVDSQQLISMINEDFGLATQGKDRIALLRELNDFLVEQFARGNQPVLIIDEAQNLTPALLEEVRMLSNLETDSAKLLQIILVGQPELRKTLASPKLLQLRQRISIHCHLQALSRQEIEQYIMHRLERAGNREALSFSPEALDIIFKYSKGIPRLINIICDFLMLSAFAEESKSIDSDLVQEIVGDLDFENQFWGGEIEPDPPSVDTPDLKNDSQIGEIKTILTDIARRIDLLEKRENPSQAEGIEGIKKWLEQYDQTVREYMNRTTKELSELRSNLGEKATDEPLEPPSKEENEGTTKKGLLGSLFRAV